MKRWIRSGAAIARWGLPALLPALSGGCPLSGDSGRVVFQTVVTNGLSTFVNGLIQAALVMFGVGA